ncbi:MAG TPA: choice-of-anchor E domain-containing protein [Isosphaeraceae bacterium]|jgi:hypothetical protein|nr:choice-of-anchor E domain-containing protein [Isosphaeraceae bacterium]
MARRARTVGYIGLALAALAVPQPASADFSTETVNIPLQNTDFTASVLVPQFHPQSGQILEAVSFSFNGQISSADTLTFLNQATLDLKTTADLKLTGPDNLSLVAAPVATVTQTGSSGSFSTTATGTASAVQPASSDPVLLALFTGSGTVPFSLVASGASNFSSSSGNGDWAATTQAGGALTVTFQFRTVPEPASLALLTLGGGGVMLASRRIRRREAAGRVA